MPPVASRLLSLPADRRAPGAARVAVREVVLAAALDELLDDALLLATELTTNAVLHVGADISVLVEASDDSVTVTIRDSEPDELPRLDASVAIGYPMANTGRGLLLVDKIAYRWGTTQDEGGKAVWFQLSKNVELSKNVGLSKNGDEAIPPLNGEELQAASTAGILSWLRRHMPRQRITADD